MLKLQTMPTTTDEITTEWLTEVLLSSGAITTDTAVIDFTVEQLSGAGYIGLVARINPIYAPAQSDGPSSLIFKYSSPDPNFRQGAQGLYAREVRFYQELSKQIDLTTPDCYYATFDPETGHSILLLEDLAHLRANDMAEGCGLADMETAVTHLAQHHAQWWQNPKLKTIDFLDPMNSTTTEGHEWFKSCWEQYEDKLTDAFPDCYIPANYLHLGYHAIEQMMAINEKLASSPFTLIHKDTHLDNMMFAAQEGDPAITFIDWQCCGYGPGVSDIAYFIIFSVPVKLRRQEERNILRAYHNTLVAHGVTDYSFEQCWRDYRLSFFRSFYVSVAWANIADLSRPHAQSFRNVMLARLASFAEDHCVSEFLSA